MNETVTASSNPMQARFEFLLSNYVAARSTGSISSEQAVVRELQSSSAAFKAQLGEKYPFILFKESAGAGNWAFVPWIAMLDSRETTTTQRGVYVVYLFRSDMTGVYLTLAQGVTEHRANHSTSEVEAILKAKGQEVLAKLPDLSSKGFSPSKVDLRSTTRLPRDYEASVILSKLYETGEVPDDASLVADLETLLGAYGRFVEMNTNPEPAQSANEPEAQVAEEISAAILARYLLDQEGLNFSPYQVAAFITALQAKGFVILTGISGTGKSQLAVKVAKLVLGNEPEAFAVRPDWRDSRNLLGFFNPLTERYSSTSLLRSLLPSSTIEPVQVVRSVNFARLREAISESTSWVEELREFVPKYETTPVDELTDDDISALWNPGTNAVASIGQARAHKLVGGEEVLRQATRILADQEKTPGVRMVATLTYLRDQGNVWQSARVLRALAAFALNETSTIANVVSLRTVVRALGYDSHAKVENTDPGSMDKAFAYLRTTLDHELADLDRYERAVAPWLLFEQLTSPADVSSPRSADAKEHRFIILDEMNLARVEYYFAEFLSVLESSRDDDGVTTQGLSLHDQPSHVKDGSNGDLTSNDIPSSLVLPPHLYVVGTVNTDETTHAFSPKVLDRAFSIEFQDVDLSAVPGGNVPEPAQVFAVRRSVASLLAIANSSGRGSAKARAFADPRLLAWLTRLNERLQPFDLHYAYRVRDEVASFVGFAVDSSLADGFGNDAFVGSFDAAVLMKVLPKFHGPRAQMLEPLTRVLSWAINPEAPDDAAEFLRRVLVSRELLDSSGLLQAGRPDGVPVLPRTSSKVARMLYQASTTGFTSFS